MKIIPTFVDKRKQELLSWLPLRKILVFLAMNLLSQIKISFIELRVSI